MLSIVEKNPVAFVLSLGGDRLEARVRACHYNLSGDAGAWSDSPERFHSISQGNASVGLLRVRSRVMSLGAYQEGQVNPQRGVKHIT